MISKIANIKSDFLKYTAYKIFVEKTRLIVLAVCGILGFPLFGLAVSFSSSMHDNYSPSGEMFFGISCFTLFLACLIMTVICYSGGINNFDYYSRRLKIDMSWSLPIKNRSRFWGDFTAGILPTSVVYIVSSTIGLAFLAISLNTDKISYTDYHSILGWAATAMIVGFFFLVSLYIFSVFCAALCGRVFESIAYPILICGIIPAIIALVGFMTFDGVWQVDVTDQILTALKCSSPFGFLFGGTGELITDGIMSNIGYYSDSPEVTGNFIQIIFKHGIFFKAAIMLPFVVINGILLTAAYFLGKKRDAESTGQAFVIKVAPEIIISLVMFSITAVFAFAMHQDWNVSGGLLFGLIITSGIAFLFLDVTVKRGFKRMGVAFLRYMAMMAGSAIISGILLSSNGFGVGKYVPPLGNIRSVSVDLRELDHEGDINQWGEYDSNKQQTVFREKENIEKLRKTHIESNKDNSRTIDTWNRNNDTVHVTYTLKNGKEVKRYVRNDANAKELLQLLASSEYKEQFIAKMDYYREKSNRFYIEYSSNLNNYSHNAEKIYEAFKLDYMAETYEERYLSTAQNYGTLTFMFEERDRYDYTTVRSENQVKIYIRSHYTNLIKELERQGIDVKENSFTDSIIGYGNLGLARGHITASGNYYDYETQQIGVSFNKETEELVEGLFKVMQPAYLIDGWGYELKINDESYVIPPEYNNLAEQLWAIAEKYGYNDYDDDYGTNYYDYNYEVPADPVDPVEDYGYQFA